MVDIITTSPKHLMVEMAQEAEEAKADIAEGLKAHYYRNTRKIPKLLEIGDKIWYVEDGYIRGFATVVAIEDNSPGESYIISDAATWTWVNPHPMKGFQGWHYFYGVRTPELDEKHGDIIHKAYCKPVGIGDYLAPRPEVRREAQTTKA